MTASPECDKILLVQAELDGELDAAQAAALAAHPGGVPDLSGRRRRAGARPLAD